MDKNETNCLSPPLSLPVHSLAFQIFNEDVGDFRCLCDNEENSKITIHVFVLSTIIILFIS